MARLTAEWHRQRAEVRRLDDGWRWVATRGSHRQYRHAAKPGKVTIAGKLSQDLPPGTWNSIVKQAGLDK